MMKIFHFCLLLYGFTTFFGGGASLLDDNEGPLLRAMPSIVVSLFVDKFLADNNESLADVAGLAGLGTFVRLDPGCLLLVDDDCIFGTNVSEVADELLD